MYKHTMLSMYSICVACGVHLKTLVLVLLHGCDALKLCVDVLSQSILYHCICAPSQAGGGRREREREEGRGRYGGGRSREGGRE